MADKYETSGIPFLRSQNILPFRLDLSDIKFIPTDFHAKLKKSALAPGDVAIVRTGYPGTACVIPETLKIANCADLVIARPSEKLDPWFLAAVLNSSWGRSSVAGNLVGVAQQHFNVGAAKAMQIALPPLDQQRLIASILSAYDDLIENNTRRIAILEEMARRIYEEWFVRFRFPGHENVRMAESELGPVPEGFAPGVLADVAVRIGTSINPSKSPDEEFAHYSIPAFDIDQRPALESGDRIMSNKTQLDQDVVLLSKLNPRIQRVWNVRIDESRRNVCSTELLAYSPKKPMRQSVLFQLLSSPSFQARYVGLAIGTSTSHQRVKPADVDQIATLIPSADLIERAHSILTPMLLLSLTLREKNHNLRVTRDHLLPRLISGELDVSSLSESEAAVA